VRLSSLDRDRVVAFAGLAAVTVVAWGYLARMPMGEHASPLAAWGAALAMWLVMMTAMMLPTAAPMVSTFVAVSRRRSAGRAGGAIAAFVVGYLIAWGFFDVAAASLQTAIAPDPCARLLDTRPALAGALLILAGAYQWTPLKTVCLRGCQSPLGFLLTHWQEGTLGSLRMGLRHGLLCIGCCWALMGLMFVAGTMSLAWMAILTVVILGEKLAARLPWLPRAAGVALAGAGVAVIVM
jgi:predicted metal-binding membrane protein